MTGYRNQNNIDFLLMAWEFKLRDWLRPLPKILEEAGIKPGMSVLDFGCGPGSFTVEAAKLVGSEGARYALDINPFALKYAGKQIAKTDLPNIKIIDDISTIVQGSLDMVLLYDVLHDINEPQEILNNISSLLKPNGVLSVSDHHLGEAKIMSLMTEGGMYYFLDKKKKYFRFARQGGKID